MLSSTVTGKLLKWLEQQWEGRFQLCPPRILGLCPPLVSAPPQTCVPQDSYTWDKSSSGKNRERSVGQELPPGTCSNGRETRRAARIWSPSSLAKGLGLWGLRPGPRWPTVAQGHLGESPGLSNQTHKVGASDKRYLLSLSPDPRPD